MNKELETLAVHGETSVGWDDHARINETVDEHGNPSSSDSGFGVSDPRAPRRRAYDDPEVERLRAYLKGNNGIRGLEICSPDEVERAARIFHRDGFVVVRDLLDRERLQQFREGSARALRQLLEISGTGKRKYMAETGRLPHRYSFGTSSASRQLLHEEVWASMIDLPTTTPILIEIFGSLDYSVLGAGGDLCLPGAVEYQHLHMDIRESNHVTEKRLAQAKAMGIEMKTAENDGQPSTGDRTSQIRAEDLDLATRRRIVDFTPPMVTINFALTDLTWENGPVRQIPGSHTWQMPPLPPKDEPEWMRLSTLVGAPAGAGVFRDNRAWHGGTPNLSRKIRALPNVEYGAPWIAGDRRRQTMPHHIWETLTAHAQRLSRPIRAEPGEWPAGAGVMHPLKSERQATVERGEKRTRPGQ